MTLAFVDVYSIATLILAILSIIALAYVQFRGHKGHYAEDDERAFFDEHGRWPDEPESAARPRPGGYSEFDHLPGKDN